MNFPVQVLVVSFVLLLVFNVPVAFSMGIASVLAMLAMGDLPALVAVAHKMITGIDEFSLLAIPFFILSGLFMGHGGIARRLIDFANVLVGRFRGGLALVNILTCMLFGAISGSATAAVSSVGGFMIPLMNKRGYDREFNASVTITAATTGLLIPPSNVMIVYSLAAGGAVSIAAIFMAGVIPGILVGLALMVASTLISWRRNYGKGETVRLSETWKRFFKAIPALLLIVIVMGGILGGVFTATEASAVAVLYSFLLAVVFYKEVKWREIPGILLQGGVMTSVVFLLIAASMAMSWVLAAERIPQDISAALLGLTHNKILVLLIINLILLAVGTFMDMTPAVLIFTPIFLPVVDTFGIHPLHFGIIMIMNLCIGLCTPPVGTCLFLGCGIAETTVTKVMRQILPFYAAMIIVLFICSYIPALSMWLPEQLGLLK
ncbi:MAG TPA: TRAP transporter large permease [Anaerohalosphaeraceae bacterium]|nr:TRAP transporter large permease [Anaerohalosphaeraceae bacterium]HQG05895.1 TRAP transporter large permease [Anaerohalosphaeraceae bacterium]HQI07177.1 TRAP transporter large permease [Anaerohalosphaeraceae bacterium]HQJ67378.1 TRAP transporter large permease [Anaerohalosphaeraceae bacterium]